ncbi:MAG TPA: hypothetical protein VFL82_15075 [Thermomicrobiales bacterium]|nr:hypothetical protein [Thermomicrobiales bacterium]
MEQIGTVARLQVQLSSLKLGERPHRWFDPAPITEVSILSLIGGGVQGIDADGSTLPDVHHPDYGAGKNRGNNGISVGFTSHYDAMRTRFGDHLTNGIAGENLLIATSRMFTVDDLAADLFVEADSGDMLRLEQIIVAAPCVEFTRYALRFPDDARPDRTVADALLFLNDGMRGYYATYDGPIERIHVGNRVFLG